MFRYTAKSIKKQLILNDFNLSTRYTMTDAMLKLCEKILTAYNSNIIANRNTYDKSRFIDHIKYFESKINSVDKSVLEFDFDRFYPIKLRVGSSNIILNIMCDVSDNVYVSYIIHAINMFCQCFSYDYDGLEINIVLDNNRRIFIDSVEESRRLSAAFTVSGVTISADKLIILTKKEELIKLLFHELIHYAKLDGAAIGVNLSVPWSIASKLNLSEAYTEYLAVIIHSIYISIATNNNVSDIILSETKYSYYLISEYAKALGINNIDDFFYGRTNVVSSPIATFEYVYLRGIFMHVDLVSALDDVKLKKSDIQFLTKMITNFDYRQFIRNIQNSQNDNKVSDLSYIVHDLAIDY